MTIGYRSIDWPYLKQGEKPQFISDDLSIMTKRQREIVLAMTNNFSDRTRNYQEVARILKCSPQYVRSQVLMAYRKVLRRSFDEHANYLFRNGCYTLEKTTISNRRRVKPPFKIKSPGFPRLSTPIRTN